MHATLQRYWSRREVLTSIVAKLGYLRATEHRPYEYAHTPPAGTPWHNYVSDARTVRSLNARTLEASPRLDREGFELRACPTAVRDFSDESAIERIYHGEVAELARTVTGASTAYVFDHLVR